MNIAHIKRNLSILSPLLAVLILAAVGQGAWILTGSMPDPSRDHVATLLNDGRVLIIGGTGGGNTAELYDPITGTFDPAGSTLLCHQQGATATRLLDGRVLIIGGPGCGTSTGAEVYDPVAGTFSLTGSLNTPNISHQAAILLPNGHVLIAGGQTNFPDPQSLASAELFDPSTGIFTRTGSMITDRSGPSATLLSDGKVLIIGGSRITSPGNSVCLSSAEVYDPVTGIFTSVGDMNRVRCGGYWTQAPLLNNGRVLIVGGDLLGSPSTELFDPATQSFIPAGSMNNDRDIPSATLLPDGRVLVAGGLTFVADAPVTLNSAEIYDPASDTFISVPDMNYARLQHTATLLQNSQVLVTGGFDSAINSDLNSAELFSVSPTIFTVAIDIKPGRFPNRIELERHICKKDDNLYVAILSTPSFDVLTADASTLKLGDPQSSRTVSPVRSRAKDVDRDGDMDMALTFPLCKLVHRGVLKTSTTELVLSGMTLDGIAITGRDSVKVVRED